MLLSNYDTPGRAEGVSVANNTAFVADGDSGLQVIDVRDPTSPVLLGSYDTPGSAIDVSIVGTIAYVADGDSGLQIIDVSNPTNPVLLSNYDTPGRAEGVSVANNVAFVADGIPGLQVIDVSNPASPVLLSSYDTPGRAKGVSIAGSIAYIADGPSGLQIIGVSNPSNPVWLGSYDTPDNARSVSIAESIACVADENFALQVIDVSNPTSPVLLGSYDTPALAIGVSIVGNFAYVANALLGLQIIRAPLWDARLPLLTPTTKLTVENNCAYVSDIAKKLHVIDRSSSFNLTEIDASYVLTEHARGMAANGQFLYVAEGLAGIEVIDATKLSSLEQVTLINAGLSDVRNIVLANNQLYTTDSVGGLVIFDIQGQLIITQNRLDIEKGDQLIITANNLQVKDGNIGSDPMTLEFIISGIQNGQFELVTQPSIAINRFTQQQVIDGDVRFVHNGGDIAPSYSVSVTNGKITSSPSLVVVDFSPINDPPQIFNNRLSINEGETVILTENDLGATDVDNDDMRLTIIPNNVEYGRFELISKPGRFVTNFPQQQVFNREIQFVHTATNASAPYYEVTVSDGLLSSPVSITNIDFNAKPQLVTNQLSISQGGILILDSNNLSATDIDNDDNTLVFIISNVQHGSFSWGGNSGLTQGNFTQSTLQSGQVSFTHDDTLEIPDYFVSVSDGRVQTQPNKVSGSLTDVRDTISVEPSTIIGATAGGAAALSAALLAGFWYRRRYMNKQTREQHQFARYIRRHLKLQDVDNFNSQEGQQFVNTVHKLEAELLRQGIDINPLSQNELKELAGQVAESARNKITTGTTFFGKSTISAYNIEHKVTDIVNGVLKLRSNPLDSSVFMNDAVDDNSGMSFPMQPFSRNRGGGNSLITG